MASIYTVKGKLIQKKTGVPFSALRIEAWDADLIIDDLLGSAITDAKGKFSIQFDKKYFSELFLGRKPDLFFKIFDEGTLVHDTRSSIQWNVDQLKTELVIKIDYVMKQHEKKSSKEIKDILIRPEIFYVKPDTNGSLTKDEKSWLTAKLNTHLKETVLDQLKKTKALHAAINNIDFDYKNYTDKTLGEVFTNLLSELKKNETLKEEVLQAEKELSALQVKVSTLLGLDEPLANNPILAPAIDKAKVGMYAQFAKLGSHVSSEFLKRTTTINDLTPITLEEWTKEGLITATQKNDLSLSLDLGRISNDNFPLMQALHTRQLKSTSDLAKLDKSDWLSIITEKKIPPPPGETAESYADTIVYNIETTYPSQFFLHRVLNTDQYQLPGKKNNNGTDGKNKLGNSFKYLGVSKILANDDISAKEKNAQVQHKIGQLGKFYENNPDLDLRFVDFQSNGSFNWEGIPTNEQIEIKKQLLSYQRLMIMADDHVSRDALLSAGFDSSLEISSLSNVEIQNITGLEENQVSRIVERASRNSSLIIQAAETINEVALGTFNNLHVGNVSPDFANDLRQMDGFEELFGGQNYCDCSACRSVLSPAAYFVDLMHFIEKNVSKPVFINPRPSLTDHPIYLKNRRPDLWRLPLTCENTNKLVPYLDIVNEVLEQYLEGSNTRADIYQTLHNDSSAFNLPFNLPLEELRIFLSHFGISLTELYAAIKAEPSEVKRESLQLSVEEKNIIGRSNPTGIARLFGEPSQLSTMKVQDFLSYIPVTRDELDELIALRFSPVLPGITIHKQPGTDIQSFEEVLQNLSAEKLDMINRLTRLYKKLPWSLRELDAVLVSLHTSQLNEDGILNIAALRSVQDQLKLSVEELCAIIDSLPVIAVREKAKSLFHRLFDPEKLFGAGADSCDFYVAYFNTADPGDTAIDTKTPILLGGLSISETELLRLFIFLRNELAFADNGVCRLNRDKLSLLFRHARIAKALNFTIDELAYTLKMVFPADHSTALSATDKILQVLEFRKNIQGSSLSPSTLWFITTGEETPGRKYTTSIRQVEQLTRDVQEQKKLIFSDKILSAIEGEPVSENFFREMANQGLVVVSGGLLSLSSTYRLDQGFDAVFDAMRASADLRSAHESIRKSLNDFHPWTIISGEASHRLNISMELFTLLSRLTGLDAENDQLLTALQTPLRDGVAVRPSDLEILVGFLRKIERLLQLFELLKLDEDAVQFILTHSGIFNLRDFSDLNSSKVLKFAEYRELVKVNPESENVLRSVLVNYQDHRNLASDDLAALEQLWQQSKNLIASVVTIAPLPTDPVAALGQLKKWTQLCSLLGVNGFSLKQLAANSYAGLKSAREIMYAALTSLYDNEKLREEKIRPYLDKINVKKRDALCSYIIARRRDLNFKDRSDLYAFFLLDVEMSGCFRISKVVAAISSLQLYVHRCLINLEQSGNDNPDIIDVKVLPEAIPSEEWEWRKNYRVWEANRKVFLYPENYIEPELRDNKTPLFKELEDELLQKKITKETVEEAYLKYLSQFAELARLKIAGSYYHEYGDEYSYYFFAHTQQDPMQYYFRQWINGREWTAWKKMEVSITSDKVSAIIYRGKLYVFWMDIVEKENMNLNNGNASVGSYHYNIDVFYTCLNENDKWSAPQRMSLLEFNFPSKYNFTKICYPFINNNLYIKYSDPAYLYTGALTYARIDFFNNRLVKAWEPVALTRPLEQLTIPAYTQGVRIHQGPSASILRSYTLPTMMFEGEIQRETMVGEVITGRRLTSPFDTNQYEPDLNVVGRKGGDYVFKLGDQQFLITQNILRSNDVIERILTFLANRRKTYRLSTSVINNLGEIVCNQGIDILLTLQTQINNRELPPGVNFPDSSELLPPIDDTRHIDFKGAYGEYFRELFFHIPFLIADHLNANQKFSEAKQWYEKIFNPMASEDPDPERPKDRNWRYVEFRNLDFARLREILSDRAAIDQYERNPFNPHAIARLRMSAYQKSIVMKYVDNLLDWGDNLFNQDTIESINEATMLYVLAADILGKRPVKTGQCGESSEEQLTYESIGPRINENAEFLIMLENRTYQYSLGELFNQVGVTAYAGTASANTVVSGSTGNGSSKFYAKSSPQSYKEATAQKSNGRVVSKRKPRKTPHINLVKESFQAFCIPPNYELFGYWDRVEDRLFKIRNCMNLSGVRRTLALFQPPIDPMMLVKAKAAGLGLDEVLSMLTAQLPAYRFNFIIEKAKQFTQTVQGFGSALLSALEKKDAEELLLLRSVHEQNILNATKQIKVQQVNEARHQYQHLLESEVNINNRIEYYSGLIGAGLTSWEKIQQASKHVGTGFKVTEGGIHFMAGLLHLFPQLGSPFSMKYGGEELGSSATALAGWLNSMASVADAISASAGMEATFQRREQEWNHQLTTSQQDLVQLQQQKLAAEIRKQITARELQNHETSIEQSAELDSFYREKFTNHTLYNYLASSLYRLYREAYNISFELSKMAERTYQFERDDNSIFITNDSWVSNKAGLLAGERLLLQLQRLEKSYLEKNVRELEITQSFSMNMLDPEALIQLKQTGSCPFTIPELAYDILYPGQYRRIIKSVKITMPCITGPYTNISCRLSLTDSQVRREPRVTSALERIPANKLAATTIATSSGSGDSGVFELSFRDERYLPFEGAGAVSSWQLDLPTVIRSFNYDSISDVIFHISYTAKDDGAYRTDVERNLGVALSEYATSHGLYRVISLRYEFPDLYYNFFHSPSGEQMASLRLEHQHFPYFVSDKTLTATEMQVYVKSKSRTVPPSADFPSITVNGTRVASWSNIGSSLKQGTLPVSGAAIRTWEINAGVDGLDASEVEDIMVVLKYRVSL